VNGGKGWEGGKDRARLKGYGESRRWRVFNSGGVGLTGDLEETYSWKGPGKVAARRTLGVSKRP